MFDQAAVQALIAAAVKEAVTQTKTELAVEYDGLLKSRNDILDQKKKLKEKVKELSYDDLIRARMSEAVETRHVTDPNAGVIVIPREAALDPAAYRNAKIEAARLGRRFSSAATKPQHLKPMHHPARESQSRPIGKFGTPKHSSSTWAAPCGSTHRPRHKDCNSVPTRRPLNSRPPCVRSSISSKKQETRRISCIGTTNMRGGICDRFQEHELRMTESRAGAARPASQEATRTVSAIASPPSSPGLSPLIRGALEAALSSAGVTADVYADGSIIDRWDNVDFPTPGDGYAHDVAIEVQAWVMAGLLIARLTGHAASAKQFECFADRARVDLAQPRYNDLVDAVREHAEDTYYLELTLENALRIMREEPADANRASRKKR